MNDIETVQQFAIGAVTIAANRDHVVRGEVLRVGDAVRVMVKTYSGHEVHTGVIVGFEPFKEKPTIIVAYIESSYNKAEMKMLYFNDSTKDTEVLAAAPDTNIEIERSRVLDWFDSEERKKWAELDELKAKRGYFEKYFGSVILQAEQPPVALEEIPEY